MSSTYVQNMLYNLHLIDQDAYDACTLGVGIETDESREAMIKVAYRRTMEELYDAQPRNEDGTFPERRYYLIRRGSPKIQAFTGRIDGSTERGESIYVCARKMPHGDPGLIGMLGVEVYADIETAKKNLQFLARTYDLERAEQQLKQARMVADGKAYTMDVKWVDTSRAEA